MTSGTSTAQMLSPWWRRGALFTLASGFAILVWIAFRSYSDAPPVPAQVVDPSGGTIMTAADILAGQQVFLKYALMENGTLWGHGAYLGPDFSAQYLHTLALDARETLAQNLFKRGWKNLGRLDQTLVDTEIPALLKRNRYDRHTRTLTFTEAEAASFQNQIGIWTGYFSTPAQNGSLPVCYIGNPGELKNLTAFFAWAAWASAADRAGSMACLWFCAKNSMSSSERFYRVVVATSCDTLFSRGGTGND